MSVKSGQAHPDPFRSPFGLRYRTLLGPIRLEYGHNLNPRPQDPRGTLLLSVGMPF